MSDEEDASPASGFTGITKEYKASPTIENYVRLRRLHPSDPLEVATTGGIEFLFSRENELRLQGIDPGLVASVLDADIDAQSELSLVLIELLIARSKKEAAGETHIVSRNKAISDKLVNYLIATALDSLDWNHELVISRELIVLIKHQLGIISSQYEVEEAARERRNKAWWIAAQIVVKGETPTYRKIARAMGVEASTVLRWFPDGSLISEAKALASSIEKSRLFDNLGRDTSLEG